MPLYLYYPSFIHGKPHRAIAKAVARETPKMWIVKRDDVQIIRTNGPRFGSLEMRFWKDTGIAVGLKHITTWRATLEEMS